jgi:hypothetical protein
MSLRIYRLASGAIWNCRREFARRSVATEVIRIDRLRSPTGDVKRVSFPVEGSTTRADTN